LAAGAPPLNPSSVLYGEKGEDDGKIATRPLAFFLFSQNEDPPTFNYLFAKETLSFPAFQTKPLHYINLDVPDTFSRS
jgi:hypothetical protein